MNSSIYGHDELDEKISRFIKRKADKYPGLDLEAKNKTDLPGNHKVYLEALNNLFRLLTGTANPSKSLHS